MNLQSFFQAPGRPMGPGHAPMPTFLSGATPYRGEFQATAPESKPLFSSMLTGRVWLHVTPGAVNPYRLVSGRGETKGKAVTGYELQRLRMQSICVDVVASFASGRIPVGALDGAQIPSAHLFAVAQEGVNIEVCESTDPYPQSWLCLAVPKELA